MDSLSLLCQSDIEESDVFCRSFKGSASHQVDHWIEVAGEVASKKSNEDGEVNNTKLS